MSKKNLENTYGLNPNQIKFCKNFVSTEFYGNGVESYIEAYKVDLKKPGAYLSAKSSAARMLSNDNILKFINDKLDEGGLNDAFVDKQLLLMITQNSEYGAKIQAIREYNKLRQRITEKIKLEGDLTIKVGYDKKEK